VIYVGTLMATGPQAKQTGQEKVVIKHIPDREDFSAEENQRNFEQEISSMSALSYHPNVVKILGYCLMPRCMVMPLMDGDLYHLIHDSSITFDSRIRIGFAKDISAALAACHSSGVIHRDLKTPNLLVKKIRAGANPKFLVQLSDFGVCRVRDTGAVKGRVFLNVFGLSYK